LYTIFRDTKPGSTPGNTGGIIGIGGYCWLGGTETQPSGGCGLSGVVPDVLPDTGSWNSVAFSINQSGTFSFALEDYVGIAGDAYFDGIAAIDPGTDAYNASDVCNTYYTALYPAPVVLFADDFESGNLCKWVGPNTTMPVAEVVVDPFNKYNKVLSFTRIISSGDVFSDPFTTVGSSFVVCVQYLGVQKPGSTTGDTGGYIGITNGTTPDSTLCWLGATQTDTNPLSCSTIIPDVLPDTGSWNNVAFRVNQTGVWRIAVEDDVGIAGDAYFDNIAAIYPGEAPYNAADICNAYYVGKLAATCHQRSRLYM